MSTSVRSHPWGVAGLAALAATVVTVVVLALAGAFEGAEAQAPETIPVVVVQPTSGGRNQANAQRQEHLLQHGGTVKVTGVTGDTKNDLGAVSPAAGRYLAEGPAGAGH
jgi:hypothetical protein